MAIKLADTLAPMSEFPAAMAEHIGFSDGATLQEKFDNKELGGGDNSVTLTQAEYEALPEEDKLNGLYYTYDTKRIYKNGVQYGASEPIPLTMEEYKALKAAGAIDEKQDYLVEADAEGILLGAEDIGYNNAESGIQATTVQGVIDKVAEKVDGLIDDTDLTSTTSTLSANKIKNAVSYSFNTQDGNVKYIKLKPSITTISVVDNYGGKIEILGSNKSAANPDYKTVKVVRLSYGDWGSYDATQVPSAVHTKIGELYYYPTDEYYYLKLYNYASFIMTGLVTAPEIVTSLPAETSAMTLIPESSFVTKSELDGTSFIVPYVASGFKYYSLVFGDAYLSVTNQDILIQHNRLNFCPVTYIFNATSYSTGRCSVTQVAGITKRGTSEAAYCMSFYLDDTTKTLYLKVPTYSRVTLTDLLIRSTAITVTEVNAIPDTATEMTITEYATINDTSTGSTTSTWSSSKIASEIEETIDFTTPIFTFEGSVNTTDTYTYTTVQKTMLVCHISGINSASDTDTDKNAYCRIVVNNLVLCSAVIQGDMSAGLGNSCILPKGTPITMSLRSRRNQTAQIFAYAIN